MDATVLLIEFECKDENVGSVSVDYVFASYEYHELPAQATVQENDVLGIFLNGQDPTDNIATVDSEPVSISTVKVGDAIYVDNTRNENQKPGAIPPHVSGYTTLQRAEGKTTRKTHSMYIAISDIHDDSVDSFVFLREKSLKCHTPDDVAGPAPATVDPSTPVPAPTLSPAPSFFAFEPEVCVERKGSCQDTTECCSGVCTGLKMKKAACANCADLKEICNQDSDCCGKSECDAKSNKCVAPCTKESKKCKKDSECCSGDCDKNKKKCAAALTCGAKGATCKKDNACCSGNCDKSKNKCAK
jgi:hypothetical protein